MGVDCLFRVWRLAMPREDKQEHHSTLFVSRYNYQSNRGWMRQCVSMKKIFSKEKWRLIIALLFFMSILTSTAQSLTISCPGGFCPYPGLKKSEVPVSSAGLYTKVDWRFVENSEADNYGDPLEQLYSFFDGIDNTGYWEATFYNQEKIIMRVVTDQNQTDPTISEVTIYTNEVLFNIDNKYTVLVGSSVAALKKADFLKYIPVYNGKKQLVRAKFYKQFQGFYLSLYANRQNKLSISSVQMTQGYYQ